MVLYNAVKLWALHRLTGHVWLGVGFAKSLLWLLAALLMHSAFWGGIEGSTIDFLGMSTARTDISTLPWRDKCLYASLEIVLHSAWTFVGLRYLGLAPDLRTFLVKLFSRLRA